jgi:hypothetical protein
MFIAPWFCSDRDGEMAHGDKLMTAIAAPNVPMADRRLNIPVHCATSERFMIVSIGSRTNATFAPPVLRIQFGRDRTVDVVNGSITIETSKGTAVG